MVAYATIIVYSQAMFERCLYFNINALTRVVNHIWDEAFAEFDLSPSHAYLLRLSLSQPGLTPKQLSQELKLEKSTITRFLDALQKKGLIRRQQGITGDAREQAIYPTKKAGKIAKQLEAKGEGLYQKMVADIGKNELTSLVAQLRKIETDIR